MRWTCPPKALLFRRRALRADHVRLLEDLFTVLSSGTRIRILHALGRGREMTVSQIAARLGMKMAAVSNQLRLMTDKGILSYRNEGLFAYYSIADPCVPLILDAGACLAIDSLRRATRGGRRP